MTISPCGNGKEKQMIDVFNRCYLSRRELLVSSAFAAAVLAFAGAVLVLAAGVDAPAGRAPRSPSSRSPRGW